MSTRSSLRSLLSAAFILAPFVASAAPAERFRDGSSIYGDPGAAAAADRFVDVGTTKAINVSYGETVVFRSGDKQFGWTFDGLGGRPVDLAKIAPVHFGGEALTVWVGRNPDDQH